MSGAPEPLILAQGGVARLQEIQRVLASGGIEAQILNPPGNDANA
jgi:hypothetical protein